MSILNVLTTTHWWPLGPSPIDTPGVGLGRAAGRIEGAAPDPVDGDVMYLASDNGGVWKTGTWRNTPQINVPPTWLAVSDGQPSLDFSGYHPIVVHPANQSLVLGLVSGTGAGVLKSTNGGLGWQLLGNSVFEGASLGSIAVHPSDTQIIYVSVWNGGPGGGVYKSTDGGLNWQNTTPFHGGDVSDVILAKWNHDLLFAGLVAGDALATGTAGVWRSTDAGANWKPLGGTGLASNLFLGSTIRLESAATPGFVYCAEFENELDGTTIVGRHRTKNSGDSWEPLAKTSGDLETRSWHLLLAVDSRDGEHILANDAYSLFESTDGGQSWTQIDVGIGDDWVNAIFDRDGQVVVMADRNVYRYDPENTTWVSQEGNLDVTEFWDITLDPTNPDVVYGVAQDHVHAMKFDTYNPWSYMPAGYEMGKVLVDPDTPQLIYVSDPLRPANLVRRSPDGGQSWTTIMSTDDFDKEDYKLSRATQKSFVMDPSKSSRLLLGAIRIYEIADAGSGTPTVSVFSEPLSTSDAASDGWITALAISKDGETVYAATGDGHVWVKRPQKFWEERDKGLFDAGAGPLIDFRLDPANSDRAFAVTGGQSGVWQLSPNGQIPTWTNVSGNLPKNLGPASIYVDWQYALPSLYVGTDRAVYRSVDLGQHWTKVALLPNTLVTDLQGFPAHNILAAGTYGRGVWEILITPSKIKGWIFEDVDGNGIAGDDAKGMAGVRVYLDADGDGAPKELDFQATTDSSGHFVFEKVPPGTYEVRQIPPVGYVQTTASPRRVTVAGSDINVDNLGNQLRPEFLRDGERLGDVSDLNALPGRKPGEPLGRKGESEREEREAAAGVTQARMRVSRD